MLFNVWNFAFNELCDLKNLKKLMSVLCPTPIIQSYINHFKYIYEHDLHKMHCGLHIFLLIYFAIYNYLFFSKVTTYDFSIILYTCVFIPCFFHCFENLKNQRYPIEEDTSMCGLCIFKKFLDVYIYPTDFSFNFFEVVIWFSKCKF